MLNGRFLAEIDLLQPAVNFWNISQNAAFLLESEEAIFRNSTDRFGQSDLQKSV
jgi:hypothetical protein